MDNEFRASQIPNQLSEHKILEEKLQLFRDDIKMYPLARRKMNLFQFERGENEIISPFIVPVKMNAMYAGFDMLSIEILCPPDPII